MAAPSANNENIIMNTIAGSTIAVKDLNFSYRVSGGDLAVYADLNAEFTAGKISAIIGPSGCGKTTLIKILAGLIHPEHGEVLVNDDPVYGTRKKTAVIFQDFGLLPWKTVRANAELPLCLRGARRRTQRDAYTEVDSLLEQFGLAAFAKYYPAQLSGGMQQRLAVVRALVQKPDILLMDEPFSSLDALTRETAQDFLLSALDGITVVIVTHSIEEAVYLADTVFVLSQSRAQSGATRLYRTIPIVNDREGNFRQGILFYEQCDLVRAVLREGGDI
jgi:NitT/TauT family transport system ATP-binding protein